MLRLLILILICSPLLAAQGKLPEIVCRDARGQPFQLNLERFAMDVAIHQDLAQTTLTLTFRNDTSRQLEGDFLLPLPPHANISGYALEVNGKFREAVSVEKKRAKLAYETIKKRGIDPGIVEKEADNLYRTRIFPIMPRSTKSVRISYLEYLPINGLAPYRPTYRYPFNFTSEVGEISIRVSNPSKALISHPELEFQPVAGGAVVATLKNKTLSGDLTIQSKIPHQPHLLVSKIDRNQEVAYLTLNRDSLESPDNDPLLLQDYNPKNLQIIWDASRSMEGTDLTKVNVYLDAFFKKCPEVSVELNLIRNTIQEAGVFRVLNGDWTQLKEALAAVTYDGASDFPNFGGNSHDFTLLVTDGKATSLPDGVNTLTPSQPIVALLTGSDQNPVLDNLTTRSGGRSLSLASMPVEEAISQTFQKSLHVRNTRYRAKVSPLPSHAPFVYRYLLEGRNILNSRLEVAIGRDKIHSLVVESSPAPPGLVERISGIAKLSLLENGNASPLEIIKHCKTHTLASDYTSLIVLERFVDHLTFRIPPPEPELLAKYTESLSKKDESTQQALTEVWAEALARYRYRFPGAEVILHDQIRRIRTFQEAQKQVFLPEDLDPKVTQALNNWENEATQLLRNREEKQKDDQWLEAILALNRKESQLTKLSAEPKDTLAISVRGYVVNPGTLRLSEAINLKEAAQRATPLHQEDLSRVALYRSATKTVYNTLSRSYQDVPLLPGDMVVVEERFDPWGNTDPFSDPFADGGSVSDDFSNEPAIVSRSSATSLPHSKSVFSSDLSANASFDSPSGEKARATRMDPIPIAFHAITLHKKGQLEEARLHLSNLRELFPGDEAALRIEAFILATWGQTQTAEDIYRQVLTTDPEDPLTTNLLGTFLVANKEREKALKVYQSLLDQVTDRKTFPAAVILLKDRNKLLNNVSGTARDARLPGDLRVVLSNLHADPSFQITVTDPTGTITYPNSVSATGVALHASIGLYEVTDNSDIKGVYHLSASCDRDQLLEITTYRNFAKENEVIAKRTIKLPACRRGEEALLESIVVE